MTSQSHYGHLYLNTGKGWERQRARTSIAGVLIVHSHGNDIRYSLASFDTLQTSGSWGASAGPFELILSCKEPRSIDVSSAMAIAAFGEPTQTRIGTSLDYSPMAWARSRNDSNTSLNAIPDSPKSTAWSRLGGRLKLSKKRSHSSGLDCSAIGKGFGGSDQSLGDRYRRDAGLLPVTHNSITAETSPAMLILRTDSATEMVAWAEAISPFLSSKTVEQVQRPAPRLRKAESFLRHHIEAEESSPTKVTATRRNDEQQGLLSSKNSDSSIDCAQPSMTDLMASAGQNARRRRAESASSREDRISVLLDAGNGLVSNATPSRNQPLLAAADDRYRRPLSRIESVDVSRRVSLDDDSLELSISRRSFSPVESVGSSAAGSPQRLRPGGVLTSRFSDSMNSSSLDERRLSSPMAIFGTRTADDCSSGGDVSYDESGDVDEIGAPADASSASQTLAQFFAEPESDESQEEVIIEDEYTATLARRAARNTPAACLASKGLDSSDADKPSDSLDVTNGLRLYTEPEATAKPIVQHASSSGPFLSPSFFRSTSMSAFPASSGPSSTADHASRRGADYSPSICSSAPRTPPTPAGYFDGAFPPFKPVKTEDIKGTSPLQQDDVYLAPLKSFAGQSGGDADLLGPAHTLPASMSTPALWYGFDEQQVKEPIPVSCSIASFQTSGAGSTSKSASTGRSKRSQATGSGQKKSKFLMAAAFLGALPTASAWYFPGSAPRSYAIGDRVPFTVNALQPMTGASTGPSNGPGSGVASNTLNTLVSLDYYDPRFHFCQPPDGPEAQSEGLGSALFGDRIYNSPITAHMLKEEKCRLVCESSVPAEDQLWINDRIKEQYAVNWMIDGLPVATKKVADRTEDLFYSIGFPLGRFYDDHGKPYDPPALANHLNIYIEYHKRAASEYRVVGAYIYPESRDSIASDGSFNCHATDPLRMTGTSLGLNRTVGYTYDLHWKESTTPWATRWDAYLRVFDQKVHMFALVNSIIVVSFLCLMVAMVIVRSVSKDLSRYNTLDLDEGLQEDFGWKLVHAEVFRSPSKPMLLSIAVGTGSQLIAMVAVTLLFALLGFLSPSNRGSLATAMVVGWCLFGSIAGYMSCRVYATLDGDGWQRLIFGTAVLFPTTIYGLLSLLNFFLIVTNSSSAVPFGTFLALVALWFLLDVPLVLLGSWFGMRAGGFKKPTRANAIPRQIPPGPWYLQTMPAMLLGGILPFGAAFLELHFILNSLFGTRIYYAFGFLAGTFLVTALTTATVSVLFTYFQLCAEEWRWTWRSFYIGGGSAIWLFIYGLFYWASRLSLPGLANKVLYLSYLTILSLLDFVLFGTIGFLAAWFAVQKMYTRIRID